MLTEPGKEVVADSQIAKVEIDTPSDGTSRYEAPTEEEGSRRPVIYNLVWLLAIYGLSPPTRKLLTSFDPCCVSRLASGKLAFGRAPFFR